MQKKELCNCGNEAKWCYMPGYSNGSNPLHCDDCIMPLTEKNGCSCNWINIKNSQPEGVEDINWRWVIEDKQEESPYPITKDSGYWIKLDDKGRPYPCCEYTYEEDGFYTEQYVNFIEDECKRVGYDILSDPEEEHWFKEFGFILWTDKTIKKVEKILESYGKNE